jgi:hypothetical protein
MTDDFADEVEELILKFNDIARPHDVNAVINAAVTIFASAIVFDVKTRKDAKARASLMAQQAVDELWTKLRGQVQ